MSTSAEAIPYLSVVDTAVRDRTPEVRFKQALLDRASGAENCSVTYIRTPSGDGSPEGLHTHAVDQIFYVLSGTMSVEVDGARFEAPPGSLVRFPADVAHRNWNEGTEATVHLSIVAPLAEDGLPFARPVTS